jgi:hypothetical protein
MAWKLETLARMEAKERSWDSAVSHIKVVLGLRKSDMDDPRVLRCLFFLEEILNKANRIDESKDVRKTTVKLVTRYVKNITGPPT